MSNFIEYPNTVQFRQIVKNVQMSTRYVGKDENDVAIFDETIELPIITFKGTVKAHGTQGAVVYNAGKIHAQSRNNIITVEKDNAGFAFFVETKKDVFNDYFSELIEKFSLKDKEIAIYGEWAGGNIQKAVAINGLPKMFLIFGVKVMNDGEGYWIPINDITSTAEHNIYNVSDFGTYELEIDFNKPDVANTVIEELTFNVGTECPIGKYFNKSGIGEGIVWTSLENGVRYVFKSKDDRHSSVKVPKVVTPLDTELEKKIEDFAVNHACKGWRLEQIYRETFDVLNGGKGDKRRTGDFLKNLSKDVIKEELDVMVSMGLEPKQVNGKINKIAIAFLDEMLDYEAGLIDNISFNKQH